MASKPDTNTSAQELVAFEVATRDLVGLALRSVEDLEVSLPQFRLLRVLAEFGEVSATRCATELDVAGSSVTRLADKLVASGHLIRRPDATNRSAVILALAERGRQVVDQVESRRRRELHEVLDRLDPAVRAACVDALTQVHQTLSALGDPRLPY